MNTAGIRTLAGLVHAREDEDLRALLSDILDEVDVLLPHAGIARPADQSALAAIE